MTGRRTAPLPALDVAASRPSGFANPPAPLDHLHPRDKDAPMTAPRAACGALVIVLVSGAMGLAAAPGCRGEARSPGGGAVGASGAAASPGAGDQLAWPAIDEAALVALQTTERFELGTPAPLAITPDRKSVVEGKRVDL